MSSKHTRASSETYARLRARTPRFVLDTANSATRDYGLATARFRSLPDFLIVGTKRGGTTSLWNYLLQHPGVLGIFPRQRGLKSTDYLFDPPGAHDEAWYRSHFHTTAYRSWHRSRAGGALNGEASPYYMFGPAIPERMADLMPHAKIIVLLRNPVERAYSHYQERRRQGVESLSFTEALAAEPSRLAPSLERMANGSVRYEPDYDFYSYRERGVYLPQVQRLYEHFPAEQILILRSEDLYRDPQLTYDLACAFLGLQRRLLTSPRRYNYLPRADLDDRVRSELTEFYAPHNRALFEYLGRDFEW